MSICDFCDEFSGGQGNAYALRYRQSVFMRTISSTESFCVIPSLGQIVEGHLLIVPVEHFCALADLSADQTEELESLGCQVRSVLSGTYGECVLFEHGMRGPGAGGCGIDHAHLHAIPVVADGVLSVLRKAFSGHRVQHWNDIKRSIPEDSSYLFFEDASAQRYVFAVSNLASQYMRRVVAESVGKVEWDWRACGHEPELVSTVRRLSPLFLRS